MALYAGSNTFRTCLCASLGHCFRTTPQWFLHKQVHYVAAIWLEYIFNKANQSQTCTECFWVHRWMPNTVLKFAGSYYCVISCKVPDILKDHSALNLQSQTIQAESA
jgi:hypothetical protein